MPRDLADLLSGLYETASEARAVASGIVPIREVVAEGKATVVWASILEHAWREERLHRLIERVAAAYPDYRAALDEALGRFEAESQQSRSRGARPQQIPPLPAYLVRRKEGEQGVRSLLLQERKMAKGSLPIVAIHGMPGTGKSTLAAIVTQHPAVQDRFSGGVLWAELTQDPDLVAILNGWLKDLGSTFESGSVRALSQWLRSLLSQKSVLVVLDNVWDAGDARACLAGGERSLVLITTRRADIADELGAELFELSSFSVEESLKFLENRLGTAYDDRQRADAISLAETVGYLPLALELAAARVARGRTWAELQSDLSSELARLEVLDSPRRGKRQMRLQATFNLSIEPLRRENEQAWRAFCWIGAMRENAALASPCIATVLGIQEREAADVLEILWNDALLSIGPRVQVGDASQQTYRIHSLLHDMALYLLCAEPQAGLGYSIAAAHAAIVDRIRARAGAEQPLALALRDDGYSHTNFVWHLERAGRIDDIHALLRYQSPTGRNAWYESRARLRQVPGFLDDIARARRLSEEQVSRKLAEQAPAPSVALEFRYALILASVTNHFRNVPAPLGVRLVEAKIWTASEAVSLAETAGWATLASLLPALAPHLPEQDLRRLCRVDWGTEQAWSQLLVLVGSAEKLPKDLLADRIDELYRNRTELLAKTPGYQWFAAAPEFIRVFWPVFPEWIATGLAVHLGGERKQQALAAISATASTHPMISCRILLAAGLARHLEEPERSRLLETTVSLFAEQQAAIGKEAADLMVSLYRSPMGLELIKDQIAMETAVWGARWLTEEARRLSPEQMREVVLSKLSNEASGEVYLEPILNELIPHLSQKLLMQVLGIVQGLANGRLRSKLAARLISRLEEPERTEQREQAFAAAWVFEPAGEPPVATLSDRFEAIGELAPVLSEAHWEIVLDELRKGVAEQSSNIRDLLAQLLPHVPDRLLAEFAALQNLEGESYSVRYHYGVSGGWSGAVTADVASLPIRIAMLPRVGAEDRHDLVLKILQTLESPFADVAQTLGAVAPHMTEGEFSLLLQQLRKWDDTERRVGALNAIAPHVPVSRTPEAFEVAVSIFDPFEESEALSTLAVELAEEGDIRGAAAIGECIPDAFLSAYSLGWAAKKAQGPERRHWAEAALAASREIPAGFTRFRGDTVFECRSKGIGSMAAIYDEPERSRILSEALQEETGSEDGDNSRALAYLSYGIADLGHSDWAIDTALSINDVDSRCYALVWMAGYLDETMRERVLLEVAQHPDPAMRAGMLASLGPRLSPSLARQALNLAAEFEAPADRLLVWTALIPYVPEDQRQAEIEQALDYATQAGQTDCLVRAIASVLPHVSPERRAELISSALQLCRQMEDNRKRVGAFSELVRNLSSERLGDAFGVAVLSRDQEFCEEMEAAVILRMAEVGQADRSLQLLFATKNLLWRADVLRRIAPFLFREGDIEQALELAAAEPPGDLVRTDTYLVKYGRRTARVVSSSQSAVVAAFATRVQPGLRDALHDRWKQILRSASVRERSYLLLSVDNLHVIANAIAKCPVAREIGAAILDVERWWP